MGLYPATCERAAFMAAWARVGRGLSWGATVHTGDYMWALLPRDSANANGYTKNGGQLRYRVTLSRTVLSGSIGGQLNAGHQWHTPVDGSGHQGARHQRD